MPLTTVATVTVQTHQGSYTREFTVGDWEPACRWAEYREDARDWAQWISEDPDVASVRIDTDAR